MNFFPINVAEALTVWDGVKDSMKAIAARPKDGQSGLDFSFVTPTLLGNSKTISPLFIVEISNFQHWGNFQSQKLTTSLKFFKEVQ